MQTNFYQKHPLSQSLEKLKLINTKGQELIYNIQSQLKKQSFFDSSQLLSENFKMKLENLIVEKSQKNIKTVSFVFKGSRDGLNANSFWQKINGKRNLFFIFKSKNNNTIFGGYSPCQWDNLCKHSQDDTLASFLFSQSNNEVYPLKQNQKHMSIWGQTGYGPIFGCNDMHIAADFTKGHSDLGNAYQWNDYKNQPSSHLFGGLEPNLSECEIFQIQFEI